MVPIVYSSRYNMSFYGLERFHPFDTFKYQRAFQRLEREFGERLHACWTETDRPITREELLRVHTPEYLDSLRRSATVAEALELSWVSYLPASVVDRAVLAPMRWATRGTVLATSLALERGLAIHLGGGFHHAKPARGEGFCLYADIALGIDDARRQGRLQESRQVAYIDLDAHQGNGVCHCFLEDRRTAIFDIYNGYTYPLNDDTARERIDVGLPVRPGCTDDNYLSLLREHLPDFLDKLAERGPIGLAVYVAGTDILQDDPIGELAVTAEGILQRDLYVFAELRGRGIPVVMLPGGGYTRQSHALVSETVVHLMRDDATGSNDPAPTPVPA